MCARTGGGGGGGGFVCEVGDINIESPPVDGHFSEMFVFGTCR